MEIDRSYTVKSKNRKYYSRREKRVIFQGLLGTSAHLGYRKPPVPFYRKYLYGFRHGRAIVDLQKTFLSLRIACNAVGSIICKDGHLLLVNTDPLYNDVMEGVAGKTNQSCINFKWIGGFLTNWTHMRHEERFQHSSKQHSSLHLLKMRKCFEGLITREIPNGLIVLNVRKNSIAILEANRLRIPIVSLVDSTSPEELYKLVTYPIPVNSDSVWFTNLFCQLIAKTIIHSKKAQKLAKRARKLASKAIQIHMKANKIRQP